MRGSAADRFVARGTAVVLCLGVVVGTGASAEAVASGEVVRLQGPDRVATAAAVALDAWSQADRVVLARADDFADALSGGLLAAELGAPLLLTSRTALSSPAETAITTLGATETVILGGPAAIGDAVVDRLEALGVVADRIGGADRYQTAALIAQRIADGARTPNVAAALGWAPDRHRAWPDAVSAGAFAAVGAPHALILTNGGSLPDASRTALEDLGAPPVSLIGGPAAIGPEVAAEVATLTAVERLQGVDRYATSRTVAGRVLAQLDSEPRPLVVVTGQAFPDALAAAPFVAVGGDGGGSRGPAGVLLLVPSGTLSSADGLTDWITAHRDRFSHAVVIGGEQAVSATVADELAGLLDTTDPAPAVSWRFEPGGVLVEPGGAPTTARLVGIDAGGAPTAAVPDEVVLTRAPASSPAATAELLDDGRIRIVPGNEPGTVLLGATVDGVAAEPMPVTVARLADGVATVGDDEIVLPGAAAPGMPTGAGDLTGGFTRDELDARLRTDADGVPRSIPYVLTGAAPDVGTLLVGSGSLPLVGRVITHADAPTLQRDGFALVSVTPVAMETAFVDFVMSIGEDDLAAVGAQRLDREPAGALAARPGGTARSPQAASLPELTLGCKDTTSGSIGSLTATIEWRDRTYLDPELRITNGEVQHFRLQAGAGARATVKGTIELAGTTTVTCTLKPDDTVLPIPGPVGMVFSPHVAWGVPVTLALELTGPTATVTVSCHAEFSTAFEVGYSAGGGTTARTFDPTSDRGCTDPEYGGSAAQYEVDVTLDMTFGGGPAVEAGVKIGGKFVDALERFFIDDEDERTGWGELPLVKGALGITHHTRWASPAAVVRQRASSAIQRTEFVAQAGVTVDTLAGWIQTYLFANRVRVEFQIDPLLDLRADIPPQFRGLTDDHLAIWVNDELVDERPVLVQPGDMVDLEAVFDVVQETGDDGIASLDPVERAEIWQFGDGGPAPSDLMTFETTGLVSVAASQLEVDETQCQEWAEATEYAIVPFSLMGGLLETAGWGGSFKIKCQPPEIEFVPTSVSSTGSGSVSTDLQGTAIPEGSTWSVTSSPAWASPSTSSGDLTQGEPVVPISLSLTCPEEGTYSGSLEVTATHDDFPEPLTASLAITLVCEEEPDGGVAGDPHLFTFDGLGYDFQAQGEFLLVSSTTDDFEVQVRTVHGGGNSVSWVDRFAVRTPAGDVVVFLDDDTATLNGAALTEETDMPGGGRASPAAVVLADGTLIRSRGPAAVRAVELTLADGRAGALAGLLGDFDGDDTDDGALPDGTVVFGPDTLEDLTFAERSAILYDQFGVAWEVPDGDRLLPGDRLPFLAPDEPAAVEPTTYDLALQQCEDNGWTPPQLYLCAYDVAVTGDPAFADPRLIGAMPDLFVNAGNTPGLDIPGGIVGSVVDADGAAVVDTCVTANEGEVDTTQARTGADGTYELTGLPAGFHILTFGCDDDEVFPERSDSVWVHGGIRTRAGTTEVSLWPQVTGTVTGSGVGALEGICVRAWWFGVAFEGTTTADGTYTIVMNDPYRPDAGVGEVTVEFVDCGATGWAGEWYDDAPSQDSATPVSIDLDQVTTGIDAVLVPSAPT